MIAIQSYFMARFYDLAMKNTEKLCLSNWRTELLKNVYGDVLEIGSGTGVNLKYYPDTINRLVLSEPNVNMRHYLNKQIQMAKIGKSISMVINDAESIGFPDESFDYIISTLVLCSVNNQLNALKELKRLLRPNGQLLFIEHVAAEDNPKLFAWQKRFEPFWKFIGGNCHLTRNTESVIKQAGFKSIKIEKQPFFGAPSIVGPIIKGIAYK